MTKLTITLISGSTVRIKITNEDYQLLRFKTAMESPVEVTNYNNNEKGTLTTIITKNVEIMEVIEVVEEKEPEEEVNEHEADYLIDQQIERRKDEMDYGNTNKVDRKVIENDPYYIETQPNYNALSLYKQYKGKEVR